MLELRRRIDLHWLLMSTISDCHNLFNCAQIDVSDDASTITDFKSDIDRCLNRRLTRIGTGCIICSVYVVAWRWRTSQYCYETVHIGHRHNDLGNK